MRKLFTGFVFFLLIGAMLSGCATTRAKKADAGDLAAQVDALQSELRAKDRQIQDLQYELQSARESLEAPTNFLKGSKSTLIRVSGVKVQDVQKALLRAGFDPGPVDGRAGKKTKRAIKQFQRRNNLRADGIVGDKTWALLRP